MQKVHCDMEDCKVSAPFEADQFNPHGMAPKGWGVLHWTADGKGEHSRNSKLMAKYFRALGNTLPRRAVGADPTVELGKVADEISAPPDAVITFRAYLCPGCLGKLALASFNMINRMTTAPSLFG